MNQGLKDIVVNIFASSLKVYNNFKEIELCYAVSELILQFFFNLWNNFIYLIAYLSLYSFISRIFSQTEKSAKKA